MPKGNTDGQLDKYIIIIKTLLAHAILMDNQMTNGCTTFRGQRIGLQLGEGFGAEASFLLVYMTTMLTNVLHSLLLHARAERNSCLAS